MWLSVIVHTIPACVWRERENEEKNTARYKTAWESRPGSEGSSDGASCSSVVRRKVKINVVHKLAYEKNNHARFYDCQRQREAYCIEAKVTRSKGKPTKPFSLLSSKKVLYNLLIILKTRIVRWVYIVKVQPRIKNHYPRPSKPIKQRKVLHCRVSTLK